MTSKELKIEFDIRNLKRQNKQLLNSNTILKRNYNNLNENFDSKLEKEVSKKIKRIQIENNINNKKLNKLNNNYRKLQNKYTRKSLELKQAIIRANIAEDRLRRLEYKNQKIIIEKNSEISTKNNEILKLREELTDLRKDYERLKVTQNNDNTNSGISTSKTPINKKKAIPNFAKNTGDKIGRKFGHKKDKLEKVADEKIKNHVTHELNSCPNCHGKSLEKTGKIISKQTKDYKIIVYHTSHDFIEYKCPDCGKLVHEAIPNHLKEECQYGSQVKSLALTLNNVGNVPFNKIRRILSGLSMEEINPCEGYLVKLQNQASNKLKSFVEELHAALLQSKLVYWDDTVISINAKQSCMRYYGNDYVCLFKAHEKKNKEGIDKDKILNLLDSNVVVEHDHNKVNYNPEYSYINAECCQHLLRDLKKVETNIPSRTWCTNMIKLFQEFDHKRNELIAQEIDSFSEEEINEFIMKIDDYLLEGLKEYEKDSKPYYASKELTLIWRIMEYRDNYIYWILDFNIPFTNNLSERNLRGIKSKMKISGQFQNISSAENYANIRSYIETCRLYGKNEYDSLSKLVEGKPYTFAELSTTKKPE